MLDVGEEDVPDEPAPASSTGARRVGVGWAQRQALLIARRGSSECEELGVVLAGWDGTFSPLIRKRVARHIDGCEVCENRRKLMVSPLALLAGVPAFAAPPALRDRVLEDERLVAYYVDAPVASAPAPGSGSSSGRGRAVVATAAVLLLLMGVGLVALLWPEGEADTIAVDAPTTTSSAPPSATTSEAPTETVTTSDAPSAPVPPSTRPTTEATTVPWGIWAVRSPSVSINSSMPAE